MKVTGLNRDTTDKFYTKHETVDICINKINSTIKINKEDIILEPSAGNGSFVKSLLALSNNCIFLDISPEHICVKKENFLEIKIDDYLKQINYKPFRKTHVIGNPPFGRQSSLAIKFIKKSCEFCDTLSFILPKSFKKESLKKHFPLNFHLKLEIDLPKNSFLVNYEKYDVPCIFQIWTKEEKKREVKEKLEPVSFKFVKKTDHPDISIRRVGGTSGFVDSNYMDKNEQSHNFIKFNENLKVDIVSLVTILNNIKYDFDNTVGPKSISKQEIINNIEKVLYTYTK
jgi:predicted RNA methylase